MKHRKSKSKFLNINLSFRLVFLCSLFSISLFLGFRCLSAYSDIVGSFAHTASQKVSKNTEEADFNSFLQKLFENEVTSNTINLHYTLADPASAGITQYPVTFGEISVEDETSELAALENLKLELQTYDTSSMPVDYQLTYDILEDSINRNLELAPYYYYNELLSSTGGVQSEYPILLAEYAFYSKKDIEDYLNLLTQYDTYFAQVCSFEKQKAKRGLFMSEAAADNLIQQCRAYLPSESSKSFWETTFKERLEKINTISKKEKAAYIKENQNALKDHVYPAYRNLIAVLKALKKNGENAQGLCHFQKGQNYYQLLVKSTTGSDSSIPELQKIVEAHRNKNLSEMMLLASMQKESDSAATMNIERKNNKNVILALSYRLLPYKTPEEMVEHLKSKITNVFPAAPTVNYTIKTVNKKLEEFLSPAFYLTAPIDNFTENCIYINPGNHYDDIELFTTLAHEGYPGHLYQKIYTYSAQLPSLRYLLYHGGYTEGWATYVEMLSYSYAGLEEDTARLLMLNQDTTLSLYATIDMGTHYDGWSLADTVDFLGGFGITDTSVISNIYQAVIENPANYLKYYIGYLEFLELKSKAKEYYKNDFSELSFHTAILDMGSAPFYILEKYLPKYYKAAK